MLVNGVQVAKQDISMARKDNIMKNRILYEDGVFYPQFFHDKSGKWQHYRDSELMPIQFVDLRLARQFLSEAVA